MIEGTIDMWEVEGGKINYRDFSSSNGADDPIIDFAGKDLQAELGLERYHGKAH
ncbi:hypothetical protein [Streptomyces sp. SDr-06]|uniref:hypothetical protein n=1 Tax=Streptomyces sp. SDr-06 TaxID=2267702 RepID=UPI00167888EA|nr:hypothetical protein [Streptomyces sp. SDr-06]